MADSGMGEDFLTETRSDDVRATQLTCSVNEELERGATQYAAKKTAHAGMWKIAGRNLLRNKKRNFATGVAMALGFCAFIALGGYLNWTENIIRVFTIYGSRLGHVVIYKQDGLEKHTVKPGLYSLDESDQTAIQKVVASIDDVEFSAGILYGTGLIGNGCRSFPFFGIGIDPLFEKKLRTHPEILKWNPKISNYEKGRGVWEYPGEIGAIAVAEGLAKLLHKTKVYDDIANEKQKLVIVDCMASDANEKIGADTNVQLAAGSWSGMMSAIDGEIVANFKSGMTETNNSVLLTSLEHLQKLYDTKGVTAYSIWLKIKNPKLVGAVTADIEKKLRAAHINADVYSWMDERVSPYYSGTMNFLHTLVGFIAVVLSSVIVFSVFNSSTMTIIERSQEIGMMRSLGFTKKQIRKLFIMEIILLTFFSVMAGGIISVIGVTLVNYSGIPFRPAGVSVDMTLRLIPNGIVIGASALLIFCLSVLTTLWAVWSVSKQNIANLLVKVQR